MLRNTIIVANGVQQRPHRHWVSLQDGVHLTQIEELILLQVARLGPGGVQHRGGVTLAGAESRVKGQVPRTKRPRLVPQCVKGATLERTKRSLLALRGSSGRYFMV